MFDAEGNPMNTNVIESTADLTPDGFGGYRKAVAGFVALLGAILTAVQPMLPEGSDWARWVGLVIAACGAIGVFFAKNDVKPVAVQSSPQV